LNLNEDLAEAISLGHDLGHTPFGHVGEEVLNELYRGGFHHNKQSLRIVDLLENDGKGLNLTWEVRDGIVSHSKSRSNILGEEWGPVGTLEGEIVKLADMVAYINHDIDDAIRAGIISETDLPSSAVKILGNSSSQRVNTMVLDVIEFSSAVSGNTMPGKQCIGIGMSPRVRRSTDTLRNYLFKYVYNVQSARDESEKARLLLRNLYAYFMKHVDELPQEYRIHGRSKSRFVIDYIAGMTDLYAQKIAAELSLLDDKVTS
jgi:dGTPase